MALHNLDYLPDIKQTPDYDVKLPFDTTLQEDLASRGIYIGDPLKDQRENEEKEAKVKSTSVERPKKNVSLALFLKLHRQFSCFLLGVVLVLASSFVYFGTSHRNYVVGQDVNSLSVKIQRAESENARLEKQKSSLCVKLGVDDFAVYQLGMVQGAVVAEKNDENAGKFNGSVVYSQEKQTSGEKNFLEKIKEKVKNFIKK